MTKLAAIEGHLVSIKNVSTHKSACLTIHVPEEYALKVIEAFGWPTMVAPVHVAIARIGIEEKTPEAKPAPETKTDKAKRKWDELSIAQQAGIMCNEKGFQLFIAQRMNKMDGKPHEPVNADDAAQYVRQQCGVNSRAHIEDKPEALKIFKDLEASFEAWKTL